MSLSVTTATAIAGGVRGVMGTMVAAVIQTGGPRVSSISRCRTVGRLVPISTAYHTGQDRCTPLPLTRPARDATGLKKCNSFRVYSKKCGNMSNNDVPDTPLISIAEARRFMIDCFVAANTPCDHAVAMADLLVEADYRGHFSHGMNRLEMYINDVTSGTTVADAKPKILKESAASAWVDGQNGLGAVVGNFCMDLAIKKAKESGIALVVAKDSNHYGIAGWYSQKAMDEGLIGMSSTNTSPLMTPTRSIGSALGTNPIAFGAPAKNNDRFDLDMATTAVAVGKIEIKRRKNEPLPSGWAFDEKGHETTDAEIGFSSGCLMPVGGMEITAGYKGYGLGLMVETLCGILAGASFGPWIRKWSHQGSGQAHLGQCFMAINPGCFAPDFEGRMSQMMDHLRNMEPVDPEKPVLVAGDPERQHKAKVDKTGGVHYSPNQMTTAAALAKRLNVAPLGGECNK